MIENIRKGENKLDFSKFVFVDQWKMKVRIGDLTKIRTGKLDANAASMDGQYPFFTCSKEPLRISTYSYDCECVLVAGNGDLNVKYYNGKFDAYQRTYIIENNNVEKLYLPYLYYFLETYIEELRKQAIGGVIKYIKICNLSDAVIELPSIEKQKKIVKILKSSKKCLDMRNTQMAFLDGLIKARFVEMFENEIEYNKVKLEEIADIVSGITKGRKTKCGELREVPYMAVSNVKDGYIDWTTVKTILATEDEIIQYKLLPDDVLMTEGGDPDKLGRGAIISLPPKDCIHQNHIFRVRLDETQILPRYFAAYLQSSQAKTYFLRAAKQTTGIASINMSQLRGLPTIVPPIELQLKYSLFSEQVDKSKVVVQKALDETQILFDSLMQKYFG